MNDRRIVAGCLLKVCGISIAHPGFADPVASKTSESFASFANRVETVRDAGPDDERVTKLRAEMHQFLRTDAGRAILEPMLALLLRLPAQGGRPPAESEFPFTPEQAATYQKEYVNWTGLPLEITNRAGLTLTLIPPGRFLTGVGLTTDKWSESTVRFDLPVKKVAIMADQLQFLVGRGAELYIDGVLIYEPGSGDD